MNKRIKKDTLWLYGKHSCASALKNKNRFCYELLIANNSLKQYHDIIELANKKNISYKLVDPGILNSVLPVNSNHQGVALKVLPINNHNLEDVISHVSNKAYSTIILLDQITDIHNVGSIIRSAACFDVDAVILTHHNSPTENCIMAKTSSGAVDLIPVVYVTNLVSTMKYLQKSGYWCYGFDAQEGTSLHNTKFPPKTTVILGSEEKGMRKLTKDHCDFLIKIAISQQMDSLNVSNAAAVALYSIYSNQIS